MKKRAIISTVASVALAGVMCVGFAACGSDSLEAASIKGDEVTKEVFEKAFDYQNNDDYKNFKLVYETVSYSVKGDYSYDMSATFTFSVQNVEGTLKQYGEAKTKGEIKGITDSDELEHYQAYLSAEDYTAKLADINADKAVDVSIDYTAEYYYEDYTLYVKGDNGAWKVSSDATDMQKCPSVLMVVGQLLDNDPDFSDYKYDVNAKGYMEYSYGYVYKFQDGKLKAISEESVYSGAVNGTKQENKELVSAVITYGGQTVTIPTVA